MPEQQQAAIYHVRTIKTRRNVDIPDVQFAKHLEITYLYPEMGTLAVINVFIQIVPLAESAGAFTISNSRLKMVDSFLKLE